MLTKSKYGWTDFSLEGTCTYELSYLDDIPMEWIDQAIHGLENLLPFCVKGYLEPGRMLCTVSYWNCHIIYEEDERTPLEPDDVSNEFSHTSMLDFCKMLYTDLSACIDDWASFVDYGNVDVAAKKTQLITKLARLKELIEENKVNFDNNHTFL